MEEKKKKEEKEDVEEEEEEEEEEKKKKKKKHRKENTKIGTTFKRQRTHTYQRKCISDRGVYVSSNSSSHIKHYFFFRNLFKCIHLLINRKSSCLIVLQSEVCVQCFLAIINWLKFSHCSGGC